jgi:hypothetical protein
MTSTVLARGLGLRGDVQLKIPLNVWAGRYFVTVKAANGRLRCR